VTGPVTALGIRDGDPAVLRALIARRGSAVLAYCERACAPAQAAEAAADAFARFRALVVAAPRPADLDPEAALLSSTRHAAAERAPRAEPPPSGAGLSRLLAGRPTADHIALVPELLIARTDGTLDADGEEQLNRLLDASAAARAAEERFRTAEHAYRSAPPRPLPPEVVEFVVAAMVAVPSPGEAAGAVPAVPAADAGASAVAVAGGAAEVEGGGAVAVEEAPAGAGGEGTVAAEEAAAGDAAPVADAEDAVGAEEARAVAVDEAAAGAGDEAPVGAEEARAVAVDEAAGGDAAASGGGEEAVSMDEAERDEWGAVAAEAPAAGADGEAADGVGDPTVEWDVPPEHAGEGEALDAEIAAARLAAPGEGEEDDRTGAEAARLQTGSGAVDEALVGEEPVAAPTPRPAVVAAPRPGLPGKGALAPAAAVVAVAAVSILATSGVFGGNEAQPPVDTGIAPKRTQVEVPEGEAGAIVAELRHAADEARRQRLAERRGAAPAETPPAAPEPEGEARTPQPAEPAPAPEAEEEEEAAPPASTGGADDEAAADDAPAGEEPAADAP
jgi:hypothetical protein